MVTVVATAAVSCFESHRSLSLSRDSSTLTHTVQVMIPKLLSYFDEWLASSVLTPMRGQWLFALLACLEKPLTSGMRFVSWFCAYVQECVVSVFILVANNTLLFVVVFAFRCLGTFLKRSLHRCVHLFDVVFFSGPSWYASPPPFLVFVDMFSYTHCSKNTMRRVPLPLILRLC